MAECEWLKVIQSKLVSLPSLLCNKEKICILSSAGDECNDCQGECDRMVEMSNGRSYVTYNAIGLNDTGLEFMNGSRIDH